MNYRVKSLTCKVNRELYAVFEYIALSKGYNKSQLLKELIEKGLNDIIEKEGLNIKIP